MNFRARRGAEYRGGNVKIGLLVAAGLLAGCVASAAGPQANAKADYENKPVSEVGFTAGEGTVVVSPEVLEGWRFMYRFITEVEFVLCLEGREHNGTVYVENFRLARMEATNVSSVRYQPCKSDRYVGTAHNHPPVSIPRNLCYQSVPDRRSFEADTRAVVDIVLCGEEQFLWVVRDRDGAQRRGTAVANLERELGSD